MIFDVLTNNQFNKIKSEKEKKTKKEKEGGGEELGGVLKRS